MATRKQKRTTSKRKRRSPARRTTVRKRSRRRSTSKKTGLSELVSKTGRKAGGTALINGSIGGAIGALGEKVMDNINLNQTQKSLALLGGGYATAAMLKKPMAGAGISAVGAYLLLAEMGLNENNPMAEMESMETTYAQMNALDSMPEYLNENGEEMYLQEDADGMYLQEPGDEMYLQEGYGSSYSGYN